MNVVSTSPSGTEICYALGVEPVAVSHACDYPPIVETKPRINTSRIGGGTSADRHRQVESADEDGHVYEVDVERLRELDPDLIISQEVCGVCAVDSTLVDSVADDLDSEPAVVGLNANSLADVFECIALVGRTTGREDRARSLIESLRARLDRIRSRASIVDARPRTVVIEWMDPIHLGANWVPELVEIAGGEYGLVEPGRRSSETGWSTVTGYEPEVIVVAPCSYSVERTTKRIDELASRDGWRTLPAVRDGRVYAVDGSSYLTRWTPRLVDAAERLASIVHPTVFGDPPADVQNLSPLDRR